MKQRDYKPSFEETQPMDKIPGTIPVFSLRGALSPLLVIPGSLPVLVILFAPITILDLWPWALKFIDWIQRMLPFMNIRSHAYSTAYPQVALLAHSITLAIIPLMSLVWFWQSMVNYPILLLRHHAKGRWSLKMHLSMAFIGPPFFLGMIYIIIGMPGDPSFAKGFTTHSRGGLAFISYFVSYSTSLMIGMQAINIRLFIDTYFLAHTLIFRLP